MGHSRVLWMMGGNDAITEFQDGSESSFWFVDFCVPVDRRACEFYEVS